MKLSFPSKMPCASVGLPAIVACKTGGKLAQVPGSVCSGCYAMKGNYRFSNVKTPRESNLVETRAALRNRKGQEAWIRSMSALIIASGRTHFRWHDSGDILSADHLRMIVAVAKATPEVKHWLPTREYAMVQEVAFDGPLPANLTVRLSAHMIGRTLEPTGGFVTSSVDAGTGWQCPASHNPKYEGNCMECRACWSQEVGNVDYRKH
jgi:hypothetical protein